MTLKPLSLLLALPLVACTDAKDDDPSDTRDSGQQDDDDTGPVGDPGGEDSDGDGWSDSQDCAPDDPSLPAWSTEIMVDDAPAHRDVAWDGERPVLLWADQEGDSDDRHYVVYEVRWSGERWETTEVGEPYGDEFNRIQALTTSDGAQVVTVDTATYGGDVVAWDVTVFSFGDGAWSRDHLFDSEAEFGWLSQDDCEWKSGQALLRETGALTYVIRLGEPYSACGVWGIQTTTSGSPIVSAFPTSFWEWSSEDSDLAVLPSGDLGWFYFYDDEGDSWSHYLEAPWDLPGLADEDLVRTELEVDALGPLVAGPADALTTAWTDEVDEDLLLTVLRDGEWSEHVLAYEGEVQSRDFDVDSAGRVHLTYNDDDGDHYMVWDGDVARDEILPDGTWTDLLLDSDGLPHLVGSDDGSTSWAHLSCEL